MKPTKALFRTILLASGLFFLVLILSVPSLAQFEGKKAPALRLLELGVKNRVALTDYSGTVVVLDFWATWCPTCKQSFPWLDSLQTEFGKESIKVLAISVDEDVAEAKKFIQELAPKTITVLTDPEGQSAELFKIQGMPTTIVIDSQGVVAGRFSGFSSKERKKIKQLLRKLII